MAVCAVASFAAAFFAAGAGDNAPQRTVTHTQPGRFADPAARSVAASFTGQPAALKLPRPKRIKHHARPAAVAPVVTTPSTPAYTQPPVVSSPPPVRHHSGGGGSGTGTTSIG